MGGEGGETNEDYLGFLPRVDVFFPLGDLGDFCRNLAPSSTAAAIVPCRFNLPVSSLFVSSSFFSSTAAFLSSAFLGEDFLGDAAGDFLGDADVSFLAGDFFLVDPLGLPRPLGDALFSSSLARNLAPSSTAAAIVPCLFIGLSSFSVAVVVLAFFGDGVFLGEAALFFGEDLAGDAEREALRLPFFSLARNFSASSVV